MFIKLSLILKNYKLKVTTVMLMFNYPLTDNNISKNDLLENIKFLRKNKKRIFIQLQKVEILKMNGQDHMELNIVFL